MLLEKLQWFPDEESIEELRRRGTTHVVIHERYYVAGQYTYIAARLDASPDLERVTSVRWRNRESRLYRLLEPSRAAGTTGRRR